MKINFTQEILTLEGKPRTEITLCAECKKVVSSDVLTLRRAAISALDMPFSDERDLAPIKKYERGDLAHRIFRNDELDLSAEELTLLKKLTGKLYVSTIVWEIHNMLESKTSEGTQQVEE